MATTEVEVWILVDESGDYVVRKDGEELDEAYAEDIGCTNIALRRVCVKLTVPLPTPVVVTVTIPDEPNGAVVSVV